MDDLARPTEIKIDFDHNENEKYLEEKNIELNNEIKNEQILYSNTDEGIKEAFTPLLGPWIPVIPTKKETYFY